MTSQERHHPDDIEGIHADDLLLDSLGRGEAAPDDDTVAAMLAAWRADLADERPTVRAAAPGGVAEAGESDAPTMLLPELTSVPTLADRKGRTRHRLSRPRAIAVAATLTLLAALGGVCVASLDATPGSLLWPISQILNPDRADVLRAQEAIDRARRAVDQGRYADAANLISQAQSLINQVPDPTDQQRLRAELDALRRELTARTSTGMLAPAGPGATTTPVPVRTPGPGTGPGGGAPGPGGGAAPGSSPTAAGGGGLLPSLLPGVPLPQISISLGIHIG